MQRKSTRPWGNIWNSTQKVLKNHYWANEDGTLSLMTLMSTYWCSLGNQVTNHVHCMHFPNHTNSVDLNYYVTSQTNRGAMHQLDFCQCSLIEGVLTGSTIKGKLLWGAYLMKRPRFFWGLINPVKSWSVFFSAPSSIPTRSVRNGL